MPTVLPLRKKNKKTAHPLTSHWVGPNPLCHGRDSMLIPFLAAPPHDDSGIMRHVQTLCRARQHTRGGEQQGAHASTSRVKLAMLQNQNAACARHLTHDRAEGAARTTNLRHCGSTPDVLIGFGFRARTIKIQNMHRFVQPNLKHHHRKHHPTAAPANWGRTEERGKPKHRLQRSEKKKKIHLRQHNRKKKKKRTGATNIVVDVGLEQNFGSSHLLLSFQAAAGGGLHAPRQLLLHHENPRGPQR